MAGLMRGTHHAHFQVHTFILRYYYNTCNSHKTLVVSYCPGQHHCIPPSDLMPLMGNEVIHFGFQTGL